VDEDFRAAFDERFDLLVLVRGQADEVIRSDERAGGDDAGKDGVVTGVHRVLDGIAEDEQQHQIERRELSHLAFARDAQQR